MDYVPPATSFWNLGFLRSGSKGAAAPDLPAAL
jgi:hypothetical protein